MYRRKTLNQYCKVLLFSLALSLFAGCALQQIDKQPKPIRIQGSDTMLILNRRLAEMYMKSHPYASVYVEGGGSARGIRALIAGRIDICAASRPMRPEEARQLAKKYNSIGLSFLLAKDALSVYVHPDNPVKDLRLDQLKAIFTGKITNWKELGGDDREILVITRSHNSGTYLYFKQHVLNGEPYAFNARILPITAAVVKFIAAHENAIGYGGIAYGKTVTHCRINGVAPTPENIRKDRYPIARYLRFYTVSAPPPRVKEFIDWVIGKEGQSVVHNVGYIPLWDFR